MQNENVNLNKDFKLSQQLDEAQKAQEDERQKRFQQIENERERSEVERMIQTRDAEMKRDVQLKRDEQEKQIRDEVQKRLDAQRGPSLDPLHLKSLLGNSPKDVDAKVRAAMQANHEREMTGYVAGLAVSYNKILDRQIDGVLEKEAEQRRQKEDEQNFQKDATRSPESSRDAFQRSHDQTGGEKDWRSLMADREKDQSRDR